MSRAQLLYQLQVIDSDLDQAHKVLARIAAALGESEALKQAKTAAHQTDEQLRQARAVFQDVDLEVTTLTQKIAQQEKLLYSGKAMSAKEATNLQEEVTSLKRWHRKREEVLLEAMLAVEAAEAAQTQARAALAEAETQWQAEQTVLRQKQAKIQAKTVEWQAQRATTVQPVAPDDLTAYETLRRKKAGRAVVMVKDNVCQGCGVAPSSRKIQQSRSETELVYCGTCGRILYVP